MGTHILIPVFNSFLFYYFLQINDTSAVLTFNEMFILNDRTLQSLAKSKNLANIVTGVQIDDVFGNGKIETIECKDGYYIDSLTLDSIKQNVASWLANNNYESAIDVLMSGEKSKINELLSIYQTVEWQS